MKNAILKADDRDRSPDYFEKHHKLPKSLGGLNDIENIVKLTAKEHYIAHLLLAKGTNNSAMKKALHMMAFSHTSTQKRSYRINSRIYDYIRRENAKIVSAYSKNTITAYDKLLDKCYRVPKELFYSDRARFIGPNTKPRSIESTIQEQNYRFPFIITIQDLQFENLMELNKQFDSTFTIRDIVCLYTNRYITNRLTVPKNNKWCKIFDIASLSNQKAIDIIFSNITIISKKNWSNARIIKLLTTKKAKSQKTNRAKKQSREKRTKCIYHTPNGIFYSRYDFQKMYGFSNDIILSIKQNNTFTKRNMRYMEKYSFYLDIIIGETWKDLGFYIENK